AEGRAVVENGVKDACFTGASTAAGRGGVLASVSSERDSEAASLGTRSLLYLMNRAAGWLGGVGGRRRGPQCRGFTRSGIRHWGGIKYNTGLCLKREARPHFPPWIARAD